MAEVWASVPYEVPVYRFRVRGDKTALAGLTPAQVDAVLGCLLGGETLTHIHRVWFSYWPPRFGLMKYP
jgi:multidrug efflux pump subunit AcrB